MTDLEPILRALALYAEPLGPHDARNESCAYVHIYGGMASTRDDVAAVGWQDIAELVEEVRELRALVRTGVEEGWSREDLEVAEAITGAKRPEEQEP